MYTKVFVLIAMFGIVVASVPVPYKFGYDIKDKHGEQYRHEEGNGGNAVKGSYGFTDARGVKRQVDYVADHAGFRAQVNTNEPGTANQNPAAVQMISNAPYAGGLALGGDGLGNGGYGVGNAGLRSSNLGYAIAGVAGLGNGNLGNVLAAPGGLYGIGYNGLGVPSLGYTRYRY